jgi:hypothetical protein
MLQLMLFFKYCNQKVAFWLQRRVLYRFQKSIHLIMCMFRFKAFIAKSIMSYNFVVSFAEYLSLTKRH